MPAQGTASLARSWSRGRTRPPTLPGGWTLWWLAARQLGRTRLDSAVPGEMQPYAGKAACANLCAICVPTSARSEALPGVRVCFLRSWGGRGLLMSWGERLRPRPHPQDPSWPASSAGSTWAGGSGGDRPRHPLLTGGVLT
uniref:Uncharacterized protein n=1 Tax=Myotis myotis TaxID=51298 RepID=A0A7J7SC01_MYOMY|nr:hypothetical protein mMyoMyo1_009556 [Myotis myotis]